MNGATESLADRTLRWMLDNVRSAYNAKHPDGHPDAGHFSANSGTCLLISCYIAALGKVLRKNKAPGSRRDFERFQEFLTSCMPDFGRESSGKQFDPTPDKNRDGGEEWLYEVFRCGFVHEFYPGESGWTRRPLLHEYWVRTKPAPVLNVDHFVRGFECGVMRFRELMKTDSALDADFGKHLGK